MCNLKYLWGGPLLEWGHGQDREKYRLKGMWLRK